MGRGEGGVNGPIQPEARLSGPHVRVYNVYRIPFVCVVY